MTSMPIASASANATRPSAAEFFRPCKQSTIDTRRRELIAAVRAAVAAGIPLEELGSLRDLLRPDRVEIIIELLLGEERREALALHHRSRLQAAGAGPQRGSLRGGD